MLAKRAPICIKCHDFAISPTCASPRRKYFFAGLLQTLPTNSAAVSGTMHVPVNTSARRVGFASNVRARSPRYLSPQAFAVTRTLASRALRCSRRACTNGSKTELLSDYSADLALTSDSPPEVTRRLPAGVYLVEVQESNIDVRVIVDGSGSHAELEDRVPRHGTIYQVVSLAAPGEIRVQVRSVDHRTKQGSVSLRIAHWTREVGEKPGELRTRVHRVRCRRRTVGSRDARIVGSRG